MTMSDVASLKAKLTSLVKAKVAEGAQSAHVTRGNAGAAGSEQLDQAAIAKGVGEAVANLGRQAIPLGAGAASAIGGLLGSSEGAAGTVRDVAQKAAAAAESDSGRQTMDSAVSVAGKGAEWALSQAPESVARSVGTAMETVTSVAHVLESLTGSKEKSKEDGESKSLPEETPPSSGEAES